MKFSEIWDALSKVDVSEFVKEKEGGNKKLSYLSWANAHAIMAKNFPEYEEVIKMNGDKPFFFWEGIGAMVFVGIRIGDVYKEAFLPVLEEHSKSALEKPYDVKTKTGQFTVDSLDIAMINKALQRCFVKACAKFGLGLNLYTGEDLPVGDDDARDERKLEAERQKIEIERQDRLKILYQDMKVKLKSNNRFDEFTKVIGTRQLVSLTEDELKTIFNEVMK